MKQRSLKEACSFLLAGAMILTVFPYSGNLVYAQEESEITQPVENEEMNVPTEEIEKQETEKALTQSLSDNNNQEVSYSILDTDGIIKVPIEGMVITNGVYYGISKDWYTKNNPERKVLSLDLTIPNNVTTIYDNGFRDNWTREKEQKDCITKYDGEDKYTIINIDFSSAENLTTIGEQAAMRIPLEGVLDLSNTKVETIGKNAFKECTEITGVILPSTLKNIGSTSAGSVFYSCSGMQFVRTAGKNSEAVFELPDNLEVIGNQSFYKCTGLPANTAITIPASVTYVGSEVFNYTPSITTITVKTDDASNYNGKAFSDSTNKYGVGNRLTVFNNSAAKNTFTPSGFSSYKNSLTYEFTLHYGDGENAVTEPKLYAQSVNVCKNADGSWAVNDAYEIPKAPSENAPVGYDCGWAYNGKILTTKTVLKPNGDDLYLDTEFVLQNPTIEFIVDGTVIETEDTYPKLNLSNDKEHTIGVNVSHPIESVENADVKVKFEYKWTDVWKGGSEGPRMDEDGFGADSWGKPLGTNTITINGPTHERTNGREYSGEDYGSGYYLLEVYGYSRPVPGGSWTLFYKSAHTKIGVADPDRTVNIAYMFDVVTSAPAQTPVVTFAGNTVDYGYDKAEIIASVNEIDGQTNTYQWYKANKENPSSKGEKIDRATSTSLQIEKGKDAGEYYYYLEVTSKKELNGDVIKTNFPVNFTVNKIQSSIQITTENMDKTYDGKAVSEPTVEKTGSDNAVVFTWYQKQADDSWKQLDTAPTNAGNYKVVASVAEDTNYNGAEAEKTFEITKAVPKIPVLKTFIIKQGEALSSIELPAGFTWTDDTQKADTLGKQTFRAIYTPEDTTNYQSVGVEIAVNVVPALTPVNQIPTITAEDKTLTVGDNFDVKKGVTASDKEDGDLTAKIEVINNTVDTSKAGAYTVTYKVTDKDGASVTKTITVTVKDKEAQPTTPPKPDKGDNNNTDKNNTASKADKPDTAVKTGDSTNVLLGSMVAVISLAGVITALFFKRRKSR